MAAEKRAGHTRGRVARRGRLVVDAVLAALLVFQMTRQFLPGAVHEATGIATGVLAIAHLVVNRRGAVGLARACRTAPRPALRVAAAVELAIDAVLTACALSCIVCGVGMSGVAVDLGLAHGTMALRGVHLACTHVLFVLAGVHAGLHLGMRLGRRLGRRPGPGLQRARGRTGLVAVGAATVAAAVAAVYGTCAFVRLDFAGYMTGRVRFAFIDPGQSVALFALDHLAVFALCAEIGCLVGAVLAGQARYARSAQPTRFD